MLSLTLVSSLSTCGGMKDDGFALCADRYHSGICRICHIAQSWCYRNLGNLSVHQDSVVEIQRQMAHQLQLRDAPVNLHVDA